MVTCVNHTKEAGFILERAGNEPYFGDLRIEICHVVRTHRNGIRQYTNNGAQLKLNVNCYLLSRVLPAVYARR